MADVPDVLRKIAPRNDSTKLSDRVVAEIERLILSGELREGEKLPTEAELCQAFGVSRSVIRDAVRTLSARGLVHVQARMTSSNWRQTLPPSMRHFTEEIGNTSRMST